MLKKGGPGYQTKVNRLLRAIMPTNAGRIPKAEGRDAPSWNSLSVVILVLAGPARRQMPIAGRATRSCRTGRRIILRSRHLVRTKWATTVSQRTRLSHKLTPADVPTFD